MKKISVILLFVILIGNINLVFSTENSKEGDIGYLFVPGMFESELQTVIYVDDTYYASTGEEVTCKHSLQVLPGSLTHSCNFSEIVSKRTPLSSVFSYVFGMCNGWIKKVIYSDIVVTGHPRGKSIRNFGIDLRKFNLGGKPDVEILSKKYEEVQTKHDNLLVYSVSRGTRAAFNFFTGPYLKLNKEKWKVNGVVFEGAIDSIEHVLKVSSYRYFNFLSLQKMLSYCTAYKIDDEQEPINRVDKFPKNIPVLFVTSKIDKTVPSECTKRLAHALANSGHENVFLLKLKNSSHPSYMKDDEGDIEKYRAVVNAFYERCNLPVIDQIYADQGREELDKIRIST